MTPELLKQLAERWSNISKYDLMRAGVITGNIGGSDWSRFNTDPIGFVMKLPREHLPALCNLINEGQ